MTADRLDLTGQIALVTGASRGIGRACALRLAAAGADVIVNYLTSHSEATEVANEIQAMGRNAAVVKADVSESEDIEALAEFVADRFGRLDILVSNVAAGGFRPLMDTTPAHFSSALTTNAWALLGLVQALQPSLERATNRARIVALSSHGSIRAVPAYGAIGVSKAALEALVRHLALELGDHMNFNVVLAGLVRTRATSSWPEEAFDQARAAMMVGAERDLLPEDVADAVLFLASPMASLVQGQTLVVDGGVAIRG